MYWVGKTPAHVKACTILRRVIQANKSVATTYKQDVLLIEEVAATKYPGAGPGPLLPVAATTGKQEPQYVALL